MKEGEDKQVYFIDNFSPEEMKYKSIIAISVLEDYVLMVCSMPMLCFSTLLF